MGTDWGQGLLPIPLRGLGQDPDSLTMATAKLQAARRTVRKRRQQVPLNSDPGAPKVTLICHPWRCQAHAFHTPPTPLLLHFVHATHEPSTHHPHTFHLLFTCHSQHPHAFHTPPTHLPHATHTLSTHSVHATHMPPTHFYTPSTCYPMNAFLMPPTCLLHPTHLHTTHTALPHTNTTHTA